MSFFFNATKSEAAAKPKKPTRSKDIPIASLNSLGCKVCPRDKDNLMSPKMEPHGANSPLIYVLMPAPNLDDDEKGRYMNGKAGRALLRMLPRDLDRIRFGGMIQCATDTVAVPQHEMECCRDRVALDIEYARPLVILGVGDAPLQWATGFSSAPQYRGRLISVKIGSHVCWYYPVNFPNYVFKQNSYGPSEHEVALQHDIAKLLAMVDQGELPQPEFHTAPFDAGIELIMGEDAQEDFKLLERGLADLLLEDRVGLDIETNGLRPYRRSDGHDPEIFTAAVGTFERTIAFPLDWKNAWGNQRRKVWDLFIDFIISSRTKECHNLAFEAEWFAHKIGGSVLRLTTWDDTMSMAHCIDSRPGTKSLDVQTRINFGFNLKDQSRVDVSKENWWTLYSLKDVLRYNGMDSKWCNKLSRVYRPIIAADPKLTYAHERILRLAPALVLTELKGLPVDMDFARKIDGDLQAQADELVGRIGKTPEVLKFRQRFGQFDVGNDHHVLKLMDVVLERPEVNKSAKGVTSKSTDESVLSIMPADEVPSAALILEHRGIETVLGMYVRPTVSRRLVMHDDKIHSKYKSIHAATWRLASEDTNVQNWPKHKFKQVRGIIAAGANRWILAADYGQIEFRCAAMASEDKNLVSACWTGYDVHGHWAKRMVEEYPKIKDRIVKEFGIDWDEKGMKTLRQESKNKWVFPCIFGAIVKSRAQNLGLPDDVAEALDAEFWSEFSGLKKWQKKLLAKYEKTLYVETLGGLRRWGPMSVNEIINMPIQGTACEIVTAGQVALSERSEIDEEPDFHPILNVHDDLSFDVADENLERGIDIIAYEMCKPRASYINVPLLVEMSIGPRWNELTEIATFSSEKLFNLRNPFK